MTTIRAATEADVEQVIALATQAFNIAPSSHERMRKEMKIERVRVAEVDGVVKATARMIPFGHFYGGRPIKSAGIAGVAVAAEMRGKGLGTAVVRSLLDELRADGYPLSSLYPATSPIYKSLGYGFGAIRTSWKVRLSELPTEGSDAVIEELDASGLDELHGAYSAFAATQNGLLDRTREWWEGRVLRDWDGRDYYRYVVREHGHITGWMIYRLADTKDGWRSTVECRDLMWTTPRSCEALLSLATLHRSTSEYMTWVGPASDPLADLLPDDIIESTGSFRTMVRLLDLPGALEARGYNPAVSAGVSIGVSDLSYEQNDGSWRIEIADGQAKCFPTERADATADVRTWAQIWSSLTHPHDAMRAGTLSASETTADTLAAIFSGPTPWICDFF